MKPEEYILSSLKKLRAFEGKPGEKTEDLLEQIYGFLMSKKFRKYSVNPEYQAHILNAIKTSVLKNEPIKLTLVFGGYKLWRLPESPEADFAELFALMYYAKWLSPILKIYPPGVSFDFYSADCIVEQINNIPKADTDRYIQSFENLLEFIQQFVPSNLKFTLSRLGEQYESPEAFQKELKEIIPKVEKEIEGTLLTPKQRATIDLNVKLKPGQERDPRWREKVFLIHEAHLRLSKRRPYYNTPEKITVITRRHKNTIAVGTTKRSVVKFWIGAGVLQKTDGEYAEQIFSPKQLGGANFKEEPVMIEGLEGKNFKKIRVLL